jgi:hypothetical protein
LTQVLRVNVPLKEQLFENSIEMDCCFKKKADFYVVECTGLSKIKLKGQLVSFAF